MVENIFIMLGWFGAICGGLFVLGCIADGVRQFFDGYNAP